jgi:hypothetical protein
MSEMSVKCGVFCVSAGYRRAFVAAIDPAWGRSLERERRLFVGFFGFVVAGGAVSDQSICKKIFR